MKHVILKYIFVDTLLILIFAIRILNENEKESKCQENVN